jgi:hypothetical protein
VRGNFNCVEGGGNRKICLSGVKVDPCCRVEMQGYRNHCDVGKETFYEEGGL